MNNKLLLILLISMMTTSVSTRTFAEENSQVVHLAKLQIHPADLEKYQAALKEEIDTSLRIEPGVLALNAVSEKKEPTHITILEVYADADAYQAHLTSAHFKRYKTTTQEMVQSLELIEVVPVFLGAKAR